MKISRKLITVILVTLALSLAAQPAAVAGLYAYDGFEDSGTGNLHNKNGGFGWSTAWRHDRTHNNEIDVIGHGAWGSSWDSTNLNTGARSLRRPGASSRSSASRTADQTSWDLNADNTTLWMGMMYGGNTGGPDSILLFASADMTGGGNNAPDVTGGRGVGIWIRSTNNLELISVSGTTVESSTSMAVGTSADVLGFFAVRIDWGTADTGDGSMHTVKAWRISSPAGLASEPTTGGLTLTGLNFDQSAFGIIGIKTSKNIEKFDEIRLAPTWDDLIGTAELFEPGGVIPEPATLGLLVAGGLGALVRRRKRQ